MEPILEFVYLHDISVLDREFARIRYFWAIRSCYNLFSGSGAAPDSRSQCYCWICTSSLLIVLQRSYRYIPVLFVFTVLSVVLCIVPVKFRLVYTLCCVLFNFLTRPAEVCNCCIVLRQEFIPFGEILVRHTFHLKFHFEGAFLSRVHRCLIINVRIRILSGSGSEYLVNRVYCFRPSWRK